MASPFVIFRKHQKELMVILTGMAMFSWLVIDSINGRRGGATPTVIVSMLALIGAGAGYIWNVRERAKEKEASYGWLNGAVIGAVIGAVFVFTAKRHEVGIDTASGRITIVEIQNLRERRAIANRFVQSAFFKRENVNEFIANFMLQRYMFGGESPQEVVATRLLEKEADQYGISVSNEYINDFIQEVSDKQLDERGFLQILRGMNVDQPTLFGILRNELRARLAMQLLNPASSYLPEQYWDDFQKFNVRHSIDATAIPVEAFAASVDAPSEGELKKLFDEFKAVYPAGANPGFRVPEKKRLAILTASYEQFEKQVGEVSDDELKALYEQQKETRFKADLLPDLSTGKGDSSLKSLDDLKLPEPSKDDAEKKVDEKATKPESDKKPDAASNDAKPETPKADDKSGAEKKSEDKKPSESGNDGGEETQDSNPPPKKEEPATTDKPAAEKKGAEKPATEKADAPVEKPAAEKEETKKPAEAEAEKGAEKAAEPPKFKSFEEVRDQLRDEVLRKKTLDLLKVAIDEAKAFVAEADFKIGDEFADSSKEDRNKKLKERVSDYAKEKGLTFEETGLLSAEELSTSKDLKIATASEPRDSEANPFQQVRTVPQIVFGGGMIVNVPEKAELTLGDLHFVYWVTDEVAEHVPEFTEEGVKAAVEKAFRMKAARNKAEERAKVLAKSAEEVVKDKALPEAFGGETVTGEKGALELTVISPPDFSWLRQSFAGLQSNPFQRQAPQIEFGFIPGVDKVNDDFMKSVAEMRPGDVKVISNADKTSYYVVHLKGRNPSGKADDPAVEGLYSRFLGEDVAHSQIYGGIAQSQAAMIRSRWMGDFMRKNGVDVTQFEKFQ